MQALCNCSSIYQIASANFAHNVTIKCLQFYSPLHCHDCANKKATVIKNRTEFIYIPHIFHSKPRMRNVSQYEYQHLV